MFHLDATGHHIAVNKGGKKESGRERCQTHLKSPLRGCEMEELLGRWQLATRGYPENVKGDPLGKDDYLMKLKDSQAFVTKLIKKGEVPTSLKKWGSPEKAIGVIQEEFRGGWEIVGFRAGMGFTSEIKAWRLISILKERTIINGTLQGNCKWCAVDATGGDMVAEPQQAGTEKRRSYAKCVPLLFLCWKIVADDRDIHWC